MTNKKIPVITHPEQDDNKLKSLGVSLVAFLDTVRRRKDESCTVRIRVIYNRYPKYYTTKIFMSDNDYEKMMGLKPRNELKDKKIIIHERLKMANDIIVDMPVFSFAAFENKFLNKRGSWNNVFDAYESHIKALKVNKQIGTASTYDLSLKSIKGFHSNKKLSFDNIDLRFLNKYESYMKGEGRSQNTISIYVRCLRRLYNIAISNEDARRELYPFGKKEYGLYEVPASQNVKKALPKSDIKKIFEYNPESGSPEHFYRDLWLFSYLCNGMNMADIFRLKYKNIQDGQIIFIRHKIAHKRHIKHIAVEISPEIQKIIDLWGQKPTDPDLYVFNILEEGMTPEKELARVKQTTKMVNKYIKNIAGKVKIDPNISTMSARHSFASVLKLSGEDISYISEAMGHSNLATTENYLSSFDREKRKKAGRKLVDF
ncbi:tyrosine-type recombinase/integrase [Bacteroidota bacterium]